MRLRECGYRHVGGAYRSGRVWWVDEGAERHLEGALEHGEGQGRSAEGAEGWVGALGRG